MLLVLDTALDVARAMVHLHSENIIHSDLKVCTTQCVHHHLSMDVRVSASMYLFDDAYRAHCTLLLAFSMDSMWSG
jgi:hypothetical protein